MTHIDAAVDGVDRVLIQVRRVATPVLLAGGLFAALLLGRSGPRRILTGGLGLLGLFSRFGLQGWLIGQLARGQGRPGATVRRSR